MKRALSIIGSVMILTTGLYAYKPTKNCATDSEKIGFGTIGVISGAMAGGPLGALYAFSTMAYAKSVPSCQSENLEKNKVITSKKDLIFNKNDLKNKHTPIEIIEMGSKESIEKKEVIKIPIEIHTLKIRRVEEKTLLIPFQLNSDKIDLSILNNIIIDKNKSYNIKGFADLRGTINHNQDLSERRVLTVKKYLISKGINSNNIKATGYGETEEFCKGKIESCYSKNRIVQINID